MKKLLSSLVLVSLLTPQVGLADCNYATDIKKVEQGYLYTTECHKKIGKIVKNEDKRKEQVDKLEKVIELKDLALDKSHERIELWRDTSFKLEDRVNAIDNMKERNKWLYFGLGIVVMGLATYGAGQLR